MLRIPAVQSGSPADLSCHEKEREGLFASVSCDVTVWLGCISVRTVWECKRQRLRPSPLLSCRYDVKEKGIRESETDVRRSYLPTCPPSALSHFISPARFSVRRRCAVRPRWSNTATFWVLSWPRPRKRPSGQKLISIRSKDWKMSYLFFFFRPILCIYIYVITSLKVKQRSRCIWKLICVWLLYMYKQNRVKL
jgi:hypothetical protein